MVGVGLSLVVNVPGDQKWLLLAAIGLAPLVMLWPVQTTVGLYALILPFDSISAVSGSSASRALTWFVGLAAAVALLVIGLVRNRIVHPPRAALWWTLFIVWSAVTGLWALDPVAAFQRLPTAFSLLLFYLVAVSVRMSRAEFSRVIQLTIVGGTMAGLYAAREFYHGTFYHLTSRGTLVVAGRETDPNQFAASLILPFSLAIGHFANLRGWRSRGLTLAAIVIMGLAMLLSMSRGAMLALVVVFLVHFYHQRRKWPLIAASTLALVMMLVFVPEAFITRIQHASSTGGSGRVYIWTVGAAMLKHYAMLGAGLNNFPVAYNQFAGYATRFEGFSRAPHNIYLGTWVETGIFGLLLLVVAMRSNLRRAYSSIHSGMAPGWAAPVAYEAACWAMVVVGLFLDITWTKYFWFCWILLAIVNRSSKDNQTEAQA